MPGHFKIETEKNLERMSTARHEALESEDYIEFLKSVEVFKGCV